MIEYDVEICPSVVRQKILAETPEEAERLAIDEILMVMSVYEGERIDNVDTYEG